MQLPFKLDTVTELLLTHINIRRELHGDEHVPACDLKVRYEGSNDFLDKIDTAIRPALYYNAAGDGGQVVVDGVPAVLPNLRNPKLNSSKYKWGGGKDATRKGYALTLDYGLGEEGGSNIELDNVTVTDFAIEAKEGGTVIVEWTLQYGGERLDADTRGVLTGLTDQKIHVLLIPPVNQPSGEKPLTDSGAPLLEGKSAGEQLQEAFLRGEQDAAAGA